MDDAVRTLAHALWEKAGKPEGRDTEFWLAAEQLVRADEQRAVRSKVDPEEAADAPHPAAVVGGD